MFKGTEFHLGKMNVLEVGGGDGCTTVQISLGPLDYTSLKRQTFYLYILSQSKKFISCLTKSTHEGTVIEVVICQLLD